MIKRFDRLDVATADIADATTVYQKNFQFSVLREQNSEVAFIRVGDAQIRLRTGDEIAEMLSSSGEGLAAIWLEADNIEQVAETLSRAGIRVTPIRSESDRRILGVDPEAANMVPLFIFDRR